MGAVRFTAVIGKVGVNPCVEVPSRVSKVLGRTGYIPVRGTINDHPIRTGLVSLGDGRHRLYVNGEMRRAACVDTGDRITITVEFDPEPRTPTVPKALSDALRRDAIASKAWAALSQSRRKEILSYLNSLKKHETVVRTVGRVLGQLRG